MTEHQDKFAIKVYTDGREEFIGEEIQTYTNYEQAKKRLKEIADDFAYGFVQLGRQITCRCTFGGFSKDATPLTEDDRKQFPDAVLIHVQRIKSTWRNKPRETRVIYSLNII